MTNKMNSQAIIKTKSWPHGACLFKLILTFKTYGYKILVIANVQPQNA